MSFSRHEPEWREPTSLEQDNVDSKILKLKETREIPSALMFQMFMD